LVIIETITIDVRSAVETICSGVSMDQFDQDQVGISDQMVCSAAWLDWMVVACLKCIDSTFTVPHAFSYEVLYRLLMCCWSMPDICSINQLAVPVFHHVVWCSLYYMG